MTTLGTCPTCGGRMHADSRQCKPCSRQPIPTRTNGITELEPLSEWVCPQCLYRIKDEQSIVADASAHHLAEAHR
jgi:DNA-directed RNA polymerase subunit RPC12/RpoP